VFDCVTGLKGFKGRGCILADDMGLGKTLQVCDAISSGLPCARARAAADAQLGTFRCFAGYLVTCNNRVSRSCGRYSDRAWTVGAVWLQTIPRCLLCSLFPPVSPLSTVCSFAIAHVFCRSPSNVQASPLCDGPSSCAQPVS
jgi:hypothetical protein